MRHVVPSFSDALRSTALLLLASVAVVTCFSEQRTVVVRTHSRASKSNFCTLYPPHIRTSTSSSPLGMLEGGDMIFFAEVIATPVILTLAQLKWKNDLREMELKYDQMEARIAARDMTDATSRNRSESLDDGLISLSSEFDEFRQDLNASLREYGKRLNESIARVDAMGAQEQRRLTSQTHSETDFGSLVSLADDVLHTKRTVDELTKTLERTAQSSDARIVNIDRRQKQLNAELKSAQKLNARERAALRKDLSDGLRLATSEWQDSVQRINDEVEEMSLLQELGSGTQREVPSRTEDSILREEFEENKRALAELKKQMENFEDRQNDDLHVSLAPSSVDSVLGQKIEEQARAITLLQEALPIIEQDLQRLRTEQTEQVAAFQGQADEERTLLRQNMSSLYGAVEMGRRDIRCTQDELVSILQEVKSLDYNMQHQLSELRSSMDAAATRIDEKRNISVMASSDEAEEEMRALEEHRNRFDMLHNLQQQLLEISEQVRNESRLNEEVATITQQLEVKLNATCSDMKALQTGLQTNLMDIDDALERMENEQEVFRSKMTAESKGRFSDVDLLLQDMSKDIALVRGESVKINKRIDNVTNTMKIEAFAANEKMLNVSSLLSLSKRELHADVVEVNTSLQDNLQHVDSAIREDLSRIRLELQQEIIALGDRQGQRIEQFELENSLKLTDIQTNVNRQADSARGHLVASVARLESNTVANMNRLQSQVHAMNQSVESMINESIERRSWRVKAGRGVVRVARGSFGVLRLAGGTLRSAIGSVFARLRRTSEAEAVKIAHGEIPRNDFTHHSKLSDNSIAKRSSINISSEAPDLSGAADDSIVDKRDW